MNEKSQINTLAPRPSCALLFISWRRTLSPHFFVSRVELLKLFAPAFREPWALRRTHEAPLPVLLHPLHKQVRDPKAVEQIPANISCVLR